MFIMDCYPSACPAVESVPDSAQNVQLPQTGKSSKGIAAALTAPRWSQVESFDLNIHIGVWDFDVLLCRALVDEPHRQELFDLWPMIAPALSRQPFATRQIAALIALPEVLRILDGPLASLLRPADPTVWRHLLCARALLDVQAEALEKLGWQAVLTDTTQRRRPPGNRPLPDA